jgi:membrane carboxypeptidase/penicillin-binding protein
VAGKTGTAQNYQDAWFCGFTRSLSTAVWMGHPEGLIEMRDVHGIQVTGGSFPAEIWAKFMRNAIADYQAEEFLRPAVMVNYNYNFKSKYAVNPTSSSTGSTTGSSLAPPLSTPGASLAPPLTIPDTGGTGETTPPTTHTTHPPATDPPATEPSGPPPTPSPTAPVHP